jgi:hypothetical protein
MVLKFMSLPGVMCCKTSLVQGSLAIYDHLFVVVKHGDKAWAYIHRF